MYRPSAQPPFYLWNPHRTQFVPTPQYPKTLGTQLNEIRAYLLHALEEEDIPQKKKHGSLEHFLGSGNHDTEEMTRDMQIANQAINRSSDDKCTLRQTLEDARTCRHSKRLHQFDNLQMIGFKLQPQPEGISVFPSSDFAPAEKKISNEDLRKQKKLEKKRKRKARKDAKDSLWNTEDESSQSQYPKSSQETFTSLDDEIFQPRIKHVTVPSLNTATELSGLMFQHQKQSSRLLSSVASKKSVAHALKGVRGLTMTAIAAASSRGRSHSKRPPGKILMARSKPTALKPTGRGRGRPRKNFVNGHVAVTQSRSSIKQPAILKLQSEVRVPSLSQSPTPSPPAKVLLLSSPPPHVVPQNNLEPVSISKFCGLKMTMKLNRPMSQSPSPAPASSQSTPESNRSRPRVICKIKVPKEYQSPKPKPVMAVIEPVKPKMEVVLEDDDDEDDPLLDTY